MSGGEVGDGIVVHVSVRCSTTPPFNYFRTFKLKRSLISAVAQILTHAKAVLDVYDIPAEACTRKVKFIVYAKPKLGFRVLVSSLRKNGIEVEVEEVWRGTTTQDR